MKIMVTKTSRKTPLYKEGSHKIVHPTHFSARRRTQGDRSFVLSGSRACKLSHAVFVEVPPEPLCVPAGEGRGGRALGLLQYKTLQLVAFSI